MQILEKTKINEFFELLDREIDEDIQSPSTKFTLIAIGGTSLTLRDIKPSTKDIDFMIEDIDITIIKKYIKIIYEKLKIKVDVWQAPFVFSTTLLQDFSSEIYDKSYKHFDIRLLNLADTAVAKLARFNEADREDIDAIINAGVRVDEIIQRCNATLKNNGFANREEVLRNVEIFKKINKS